VNKLEESQQLELLQYAQNPQLVFTGTAGSVPIAFISCYSRIVTGLLQNCKIVLQFARKI
jgi:hypothetical protein